MKRGLVIGKFMPLHRGHIALIEFAAKQCDELIVSMTYGPADPIPGPRRFVWIQEEFYKQRSIKPEISLDNFDDESLPWTVRIHRWVAFLKSRFPVVQVIFSSEEYGPLLAKELGVLHVPFDPERKEFPVSGSMIREKPFRYWDLIAVHARPYFVKKICFYGPESTGKTTIAQQMALHYKTEFVPEVSREIITSNDFSVQDIIAIGHAQTERVLTKVKTANRLLFCDTDLITTEIYSEHYLNIIPPVLYELEEMVKYDRYFLFDVDVPWISDGLRDLGERRREMYEVFKQQLDNRKISYSVVSGSYADREMFVQSEIDRLIDP